MVLFAQVGDGTTSVTLLAGELLKEMKPFIEDGVHPQIIIRCIRKAVALVSSCRPIVLVTQHRVLTLVFVSCTVCAMLVCLVILLLISLLWIPEMKETLEVL